MPDLDFDAWLITFQALISQITEVVDMVFTEVPKLFAVIYTQPLLLVPVSLMVGGSIFGFASRLMSVARGR